MIENMPPEARYPNLSIKIVLILLVGFLFIIAMPVVHTVEWARGAGMGETCEALVENVERRTTSSRTPSGRHSKSTLKKTTISYSHNGERHSFISTSSSAFPNVMAGDYVIVRVHPESSKVLSYPIDMSFPLIFGAFGIFWAVFSIRHIRNCIRAHPPGSLTYKEARAKWAQEQLSKIKDT